MKVKVARSRKHRSRKHRKLAPLRQQQMKISDRQSQHELFEENGLQDSFKKINHNDEEFPKVDSENFSPSDYEIFSSEQDVSINEVSGLKEVLISMGLKDHLMEYSVAGKSMESQLSNITTICGRASSFLMWAFEYLRTHYRDEIIEPISPEMIVWTFTKVIRKHFTILDKYCKTVLHAAQSLKAGTINNHLLDISKVAQWCAHYRDSWDEDGPETHHLVYFKDHIRLLSKQYSKLAKLEGNEKSMDREVQLGRLPKGGLSALQVAIKKAEPWIDNLLTKKYPINSSNYMHFMGILFAALYVDAPQGRIGGLSHVGVNQYMHLVSHNFATTSKFKTSATFGLQAITCRTFSKRLLVLYWDTFRPVASTNISTSEDNMLFLNFSGMPIKSRLIGQLVTKTFLDYTQCHVTTTGCRTLVETACQDAFDSGLITQDMREGVRNINTHGSQVTKNHYIMKNRARDTRNATKAFDLLEKQSTENTNEDGFDFEDFSLSDLDDINKDFQSPVYVQHDGVQNQPAVGFITPPGRELVLDYERGDGNISIPISNLPSDIIWGTRHPDFGKQDQNDSIAQFRARWSDEEIQYIRTCCDELLAENPKFKSTIKAKCLQHIRSDPVAYPIFHFNHVRDSGRLCHGYNRAIQS